MQNLAGVRKVIGKDVKLMVDFNQSLDGARGAAPHPRPGRDSTWRGWRSRCPAEDLAGHARVRSGSPVPIQTGENWWFGHDMAHAFAAGACDLCMPDVMKMGGVTGWLRAVGQAEAAAVPVSSHLFVEASAHLLPVTPLAHYLEFLDLAGAVADRAVAAGGRPASRPAGPASGWSGTRRPWPATCL